MGRYHGTIISLKNTSHVISIFSNPELCVFSMLVTPLCAFTTLLAIAMEMHGSCVFIVLLVSTSTYQCQGLTVLATVIYLPYLPHVLFCSHAISQCRFHLNNKYYSCQLHLKAGIYFYLLICIFCSHIQCSDPFWEILDEEPCFFSFLVSVYFPCYFSSFFLDKTSSQVGLLRDS